jgi:hypothetical protein
MPCQHRAPRQPETEGGNRSAFFQHVRPLADSVKWTDCYSGTVNQVRTVHTGGTT